MVDRVSGLKVVHLSTYDVTGGAARAAYRLHCALIQSGINSKMLVRSKSSDDPTVIEVAPIKPPSLARRLLSERMARFWRERRLRDGAPEGIWHDCRSEFGAEHFAEICEADVVHLHWTSGLLDWPTVLPWLSSAKPLAWTLHDMNPFLGTLHYPEITALPKAFARWEQAVLAQKQAILHAIPDHRIHFLAPSRWMKSEAETSQALSRFSIDHLASGVCGNTFRPLEEKKSLRAALGINRDRIVLGFVAQSLADRRKGFKLFLEALEGLGELRNRFLLLSVGANPPKVNSVHTIHLGSFDSELIMNIFFNAMDFFVCPSLADNLPNTVLEAMSCGVPSIAFDVGGLPDMVEEKKTGWLVPISSGAPGLAQCILKASFSSDLTAQGVRATASERFSMQKYAAGALKVYAKLVAFCD